MGTLATFLMINKSADKVDALVMTSNPFWRAFSDLNTSLIKKKHSRHVQ